MLRKDLLVMSAAEIDTHLEQVMTVFKSPQDKNKDVFEFFYRHHTAVVLLLGRASAMRLTSL